MLEGYQQIISLILDLESTLNLKSCCRNLLKAIFFPNLKLINLLTIK